jgi:hypothetical protein
MAPALTRRSGLRNPAFTGRLYQEGTTTASSLDGAADFGVGVFE